MTIDERLELLACMQARNEQQINRLGVYVRTVARSMRRLRGAPRPEGAAGRYTEATRRGRKRPPRTYGTGSLFLLPTGKWLLQYKPSWAQRTLSKTVGAGSKRLAERALWRWILDLDDKGGAQ